MAGEPFDLPPEALGRIPLFAELAKVLAWTGGPVNWDLAGQIGVATAASAAPAGEVTDADAAELAEGARLAELWLAEATGLEPPATLGRLRALTPAGWAETGPDALRELVDPLAGKVAKAMSEQAPDEVPQAAMAAQAMAQLAPLFLGVQAGVAIGSLARSILGAHDLPWPPGDTTMSVLVPSVDAFAQEFGLDRAQTRLWVVLHEYAHRIEHEALPWVRPHFFALFHNYVAAVDVDLSDAVARFQGMDLGDIERLEEQLGAQGFFGLLDSAGTSSALERVRHLLALLEAFADRAVEAAGSRLPDAARITEALARRRAESGGGTSVLGAFVGLDVPPVAVRAADGFCRRTLAEHGWRGLARMWDEPESLPTPAELGDPPAWAARTGVAR
jgi:putative hydrolase